MRGQLGSGARSSAAAASRAASCRSPPLLDAADADCPRVVHISDANRLDKISGTAYGSISISPDTNSRPCHQTSWITVRAVTSSMASLPLLTPGRGLMFLANLMYTGG